LSFAVPKQLRAASPSAAARNCLGTAKDNPPDPGRVVFYSQPPRKPPLLIPNIRK